MSARASDWADSEDHEYLDTWVGRRIVGLTTGEDNEVSWVRLELDDGRTVEVEASLFHDRAWLTVQDRD